MERSYFYDSTEEIQRIYQAADFARFHSQIIGNGVSNSPNYPNLSVEEKQNMTVSLGAGYMFANGYMYENTAALDLVVDTAHTSQDRIDRVVIRFDENPAERRIYAVIKKGIPTSSPVAPPITRDGYIFEMSVAQILVKAGKSFIAQTEITDERANSSVCGYIPLHNIYRGMQINEYGMVSMPNQSFMKSMNNAPIQLTNTRKTLPFGTIETDKQQEVINNTTFKAKADGIYQFWVELAWQQESGLTGVDVQIYLYVNGSESFPLAAKVLADENDNFVIQSGFDELREGDEVTIEVLAFRSGNLPTTRFTRVRIAKMA
ncbi:hypothetical protein M3E13_15670 [Oceanobacillus kimchii]|uniref:hypothetical protein n=1 Tax=Oceanobacillus kimchii TaxID=746691 RepID=UPI0021A4744F|nr:hypothetical protein [Oceanobacillus kimchii]MCT1575704.1 hypothetical protein [Oceanobacillus kimchii]MCT2137334.1 hypothetical protein [Oceanobacillus kimchii]